MRHVTYIYILQITYVSMYSNIVITRSSLEPSVPMLRKMKALAGSYELALEQTFTVEVCAPSGQSAI